MDVPKRDWAKLVVCFADHQPIQAEQYATG